jgi:hypothetical protein
MTVSKGVNDFKYAEGAVTTSARMPGFSPSFFEMGFIGMVVLHAAREYHSCDIAVLPVCALPPVPECFS